MTRPAARRAFTLIEVVLAISLALTLLVALLLFYRETTTVRDAIGEQVEIVGSERSVMDHMTSELRCSIPNPLAGAAFQGSNTGMRFSTTVLPEADAWAVPSALDSQSGPSGSDREIVGYQVRVSEDEDGNPVVEGLERTSQRLVAAVTVEGVDTESQLVAPKIQFLHLAYWDGAAWVESWSGSGLPAAVEIVMGLQPLPTGVEPADYPYTFFRRVVAVPAGARPAASGTVILGMDGGASP
jgi:hypothetical protein